ncbi:MAG: DUF1697 domain-containing protein [Oscillospiraceae bacterium]|nr:DUF1697 domain-containing protein [Oscillospiraceae bacterium]
MMKYIALLRGVNVGGKNIIKMADLKNAFEQRGFQSVTTYINSGNVLFDSVSEETEIKPACESLIAERFGISIPVFVTPAADLIDALSHAPEWWIKMPDSRHDAFFVIPPATARQIVARIGQIKEEYERLAYYGRGIFWSAPKATFSRTRVSKIIPKDESIYNAVTVRNANTAFKLAKLAGEAKK